MREKIILVFIPVILWLGVSAPLHADGISHFQFKEKQGHFSVESRFTVEADPDVVWNTLTDFEYYPKFSRELKKVKVLKRSPNHALLEQTAESGFLFITQKVFFLLDIRLSRGRSIVSEDIGHKSFVSYKTEWKIQPNPDGPGRLLNYRLAAEGHFGGPAFMVNDGFQGGVRNFLESVRKEILRRQKLTAAKDP